MFIGISNFSKTNLQFDEKNEAYDFSDELLDKYPELIISDLEDKKIDIGFCIGIDSVDFTKVLKIKTKFQKFLQKEFPEYVDKPIKIWTGAYADGYLFQSNNNESE